VNEPARVFPAAANMPPGRVTGGTGLGLPFATFGRTSPGRPFSLVGHDPSTQVVMIHCLVLFSEPPAMMAMNNPG
jgi:hypothetical protein